MTTQEQMPIYEEASRRKAALELLRFKAMRQMCEGKSTCTLYEDDVNEILCVAGLGVITPDSLKEKTLEVII